MASPVREPIGRLRRPIVQNREDPSARDPSARQPEPADRQAAAPDARRRMLMIVNPHATAVTDALRRVVVRALEGRFDVDAVQTRARGHATELSRAAAREGYDVVVTLGGDGTVNEAANGLRGSSTPLCALPGGSANVFAKLLGIPGEIVDATEHLLALADDWRPRKVSLGVVNDRCFTFASGLGLDASVVERVDSNPAAKARLGAYYFVWVAVTTFLRRYLLRPPRLRVHAGEQTLDGVTAIVQNGASFTYFQDRPIKIVDGAALESSALAGGVLHRASPLSMPAIAWRAFSPRTTVAGHRQVTGLEHMRELTVTSADERPLPLQVDGDYLGDVDQARYSVLPESLSVVA
jgi:diacylglycerol kinase family enzyme